MKFKVGQTVTIPVLKRHITHSSGACLRDGANNVGSLCVMADAIRDAFPGATNVGVGSYSSSFQLDGAEVSLSGSFAMRDVIRTFDETMESVYSGDTPLRDAIKAIWSKVPRKATATVERVYPL